MTSIPAVAPRCPRCDRLSADNTRHCPDSRTCDWMRCRCGAVYDAKGRSYGGQS